MILFFTHARTHARTHTRTRQIWNQLDQIILYFPTLLNSFNTYGIVSSHLTLEYQSCNIFSLGQKHEKYKNFFIKGWNVGIINEALFRISQIVLFSLYKIKNLSPEKTQIPLKKYKLVWKNPPNSYENIPQKL